MTIIMYRKCHKCALNFLAEESDKTNRVLGFIQREILYLIAVFFNGCELVNDFYYYNFFIWPKFVP